MAPFLPHRARGAGRLEAGRDRALAFGSRMLSSEPSARAEPPSLGLYEGPAPGRALQARPGVARLPHPDLHSLSVSRGEAPSLSIDPDPAGRRCKTGENVRKINDLTQPR